MLYLLGNAWGEFGKGGGDTTRTFRIHTGEWFSMRIHPKAFN